MPALRTILPLNRWNILVLVGSSVLLIGVLWLDYITVWTMLLFYLLPIIVVATLVRGYWWAGFALLTTLLWYGVRYSAPPPDAMLNGVRESWGSAVWNSSGRLGILLVVGFLCAKLRHYSRTPEALNSSHDTTGLLSAGGLRETLARRHTVERLAEGPVAVLLLDVERRVSAYAGQSSEYGALVGAMVSKVVMSNARASDVCARLSPNHFLVIMPNTDKATAVKLNNAVQEALPEIVRSLGDSVSISSLLLTSDTPVTNMNRMMSYAENRLITLKVMGQGRSHAETWAPAQQAPLTTG